MEHIDTNCWCYGVGCWWCILGGYLWWWED